MTQGRRLVVGITGASGSLYAERFIEVALRHFEKIYVVCTETGRQVLLHELKTHEDKFSLRALLSPGSKSTHEKIKFFDQKNYFAPIASGTSAATDMVVLPCSMGTLARIACGLSSNLLDRAADVVLKEKGRLILVPRESPLSSIHLENMLKLSHMGCHIVPAMPGFYHHPQTISDVVDFVVAKVFDSLQVNHGLTEKWNESAL